MKIRVLGNHSNTHAGCVAVWEVLTGALKQAGHMLVEGDDFDALVVNGEGSMHHDRPTHHVKMKALRDAVERGRKAYLVNSVWQLNSGMYDDVLRALDGIVVRETLSARDMRDRHGIEPRVSIDLSHFAHILEENDQQSKTRVAVTTDYHSEEFGLFVRLTTGPISKMPYVEMRNVSWSALVHTLRERKLLVTGRQHAVYAACRARLPFLALRGNTHKIEGLIASANVNIPVATSAEELNRMVATIPAEVDRTEFDKLFDWMDQQRLSNALPFFGIVDV